MKIVCLLINLSSLSSALKLAQDPEFDITDMSYEPECGNRFNWWCWKKGGHSRDKHEKAERAHFQMHTNIAVSITVKPHTSCNTNTKIEFGATACGATYATRAVVASSANAVQLNKNALNVVAATTAGTGCTGGNSGTAKPANAVPKQIASGSSDDDLASACDADGDAAITAVIVTTTPLTGKKLSIMEMRGNGLHEKEKPLVGAALATKKCYSLQCLDTVTNCALTPLSTGIPSVAVFCASSLVVMKYYSNAGCATEIAAGTVADGYGSGTGGLAVAAKSNGNCFQVGLSHWWCPTDFIMAQGACR